MLLSRDSADNHEVVQSKSCRDRPAEALGHLAWLGAAQHGPILEEQHGKLVGAYPGRVQQDARVLVPRDVEPAIGDEIAREKVFDLVRPRRPLVSDEPQSLRLGEVFGLP